MELFDVIVERHNINSRYFRNSILLEGTSDEYENAMRDLRKKAGDKLFDKACLSRGIKSRVNLTIKTPKESKVFDITNLIMDSFSMPNESFDERLSDIFSKYKDGLLKDIDDYAKMIDELIVNKDIDNDDWYFDNHEAFNKEEIESKYYRRIIVNLIESRFDYDRCNSNNHEVLQYQDDEETIPALDTIDELIELFEVEESTLERKVYADDSKFNLVKELQINGIFKTVYYHYKNGKDTEFSRKFYYNIATFLGLAGMYTEDFLKLHGLSFLDSKMYDARIYKTVFNCGLDYEYLKYMLDVQKSRREKAKQIEEKRKYETKESLETKYTRFKRTFNFERDYLIPKDEYESYDIDKLDTFFSTVDTMCEILHEFIVNQEPKDRKRLNRNKKHEESMFYNGSTKSKNYEIYERRFNKNLRLLKHDLTQIFNDSINLKVKGDDWTELKNIEEIKAVLISLELLRSEVQKLFVGFATPKNYSSNKDEVIEVVEIKD